MLDLSHCLCSCARISLKCFMVADVQLNTQAVWGRECSLLGYGLLLQCSQENAEHHCYMSVHLHWT